jgi:hypothetical protein
MAEPASMIMNANDARFSVDEILASSWDRKLAKDLAAEIGACTGDQLGTVREMRRFLALKGYRELLQRLREAREGRMERTRSLPSLMPCDATLSRGRPCPRPPSGRPPRTVPSGARRMKGFTP